MIRSPLPSGDLISHVRPHRLGRRYALEARVQNNFAETFISNDWERLVVLWVGGIVNALLRSPADGRLGRAMGVLTNHQTCCKERCSFVGGRVAEWFKAPDSKSGVRETVS